MSKLDKTDREREDLADIIMENTQLKNDYHEIVEEKRQMEDKIKN